MRPLTMVAFALALPQAATADSAAELRDRGDALLEAGDLEGALQSFNAAQTAGDRSAETWKRIGSAQRDLRRFGEAAAALEKAVAEDPGDRGAAGDLADLRRTRGLRINGWLGGDEPGTSRQALNLEVWYGGLDRLELRAGYGYSDLIFFQSNKAFATATWFYAPRSYAMADFTYRKYSYLDDPAVGKPNPDTTSYDEAPRGVLEVQHWFGRSLRGTLAYQLSAPTFWHDASTRIVNHKLTAEVAVRLPYGLSAGVVLGGLRDPDPKATLIANRPGPTAAPLVTASATSVRYRIEPILGGFARYDRGRWGVEVRTLTNRDLDASCAYSFITTAALLPLERTEILLSWIHDRYSDVSNYPGKLGEALWGSGRYWLMPSLAVGGGAKWVNNPSPQSSTDRGWRNSLTLLLNFEYRVGLL